MASTRDYLEYLNQKIEIAPVNSEEEYQAAGVIESLMHEHGLEVRVQDFEAPGLGAMPYKIVGILMFLGVFLAGLLGTVASIVGELLTLACLVLLGVRYFGVADPLGKLGRPINSQNVIGVHRATGPLVARGTRPIVIVAHYDTPRENLLFAPPFDRWQTLLRRFAPQFVGVAGVLTFVQILGFLPLGLRHILWVLAIVCALPQLLVGIASIQERFATCTEGSNDNKSGVAAMLGVMAKVHPGDDAATGYELQREERDRERELRLQKEAEEAAAEAARLEAEAAAAEEAATAEDDADFDEDEFADSEAEFDEFEDEEAFEDSEAEADESYDDEPLAEGEEFEDLDEDYPEDYPEDEEVGDFVEDAEVDGEYDEYDEDEPYDEDYDEEYDDEGYEEGYDERYDEPVAAEPPAPRVVTRREVQVERVEGVRHGKQQLESLGILPENCEIIYVEPQVSVRTYEETVVDEPEDEAAYNDYDAYDDVEGAYEYQDEQPAEDGVFGRIRGFFSGIRQTVADKLAARREARGEDVDSYENDESYVPEVLDGIIEEEYDDAPIEAADEYAEFDEAQDDYATDEVAPSDEADETDASDGGEVLEFVSSTGDADAYDDQAQQMDDDGSLGGTQIMDNLDEPIIGPSEEDLLLSEVHAVVDGEGTLPVSDAESTAAIDGTLPFVPMGHLADGREVDEMADTKDTTGIMTLATDRTVMLQHDPDQKPTPAPVDDPNWGKSEFKPGVSNVARRAVLFDLPDPMGTTGENDPLRGSLDSTAPSPVAGSNSSTQQGQGGGLFGRKRADAVPEVPESLGSWLGVGDDFDAKSEGEAIGTWDNFEDAARRGDDWKGGAARRSDLRDEVEDDVRMQDDELRDAVLSMGDEELLAHDIWFVALGGSYANHAGMQEFLNENRASVRGCFLVNLDCVGAGELSLLTEEGLAGTRRADRRMVRMISKIAEDLHINLSRVSHAWEDTDATPAMRARLRSVTLCGLNPDGSFALSQVPDDDPDLVDPEQTSTVAELVAELIRRA